MTENTPTTSGPQGAKNGTRRFRQRGKPKPQGKEEGQNVPANEGANPAETPQAPVTANGTGKEKQNRRRQRGKRNAKVGNSENGGSSPTVQPDKPPAANATDATATNGAHENKAQKKGRNRRNRENKQAGNNAAGGVDAPKNEDVTPVHSEPNKADEPGPQEATKKLTPLERRRLKRRNQRLRKKQEGQNGAAGADANKSAALRPSMAESTNEANPSGSKTTIARNKNGKTKARNTESFDPKSTLVRPSLRVHVASGRAKEYNKPLKHDDAIIVPELFGEEQDTSIFDKLVAEISQLQTDEVKGAEWTSWHQGAHMIAKDPKDSKTFQEVVDKLCEYFKVQKDTTFSRLNWYRDSKDWKPFHHDSAAFNKQLAKKQNITVGVSFGACRELAFMKVKGEGVEENDCKIYFPQPNNTCFTFGRDVNINFKHGINALPESEQDGKGRISIIVWGWTDNVIEEEQSPAMVGDEEKGPEPAPAALTSTNAKVVKRKQAKNARRREKHKAERVAKLEQKGATQAAKDEEGATVEPDIVVAPTKEDVVEA